MDLLTENMACFKERSGEIRIEGHCDERGTTDYNLALGQRRADAVKGWLINQAVAGRRMRTVSPGGAPRRAGLQRERLGREPPRCGHGQQVIGREAGPRCARLQPTPFPVERAMKRLILPVLLSVSLAPGCVLDRTGKSATEAYRREPCAARRAPVLPGV